MIVGALISLAIITGAALYAEIRLYTDALVFVGCTGALIGGLVATLAA